jgi:hypothetical protein
VGGAQRQHRGLTVPWWTGKIQRKTSPRTVRRPPAGILQNLSAIPEASEQGIEFIFSAARTSNLHNFIGATAKEALWQLVYLLLACEQRKRDGLRSRFALRQTRRVRGYLPPLSRMRIKQARDGRSGNLKPLSSTTLSPNVVIGEES